MPEAEPAGHLGTPDDADSDQFIDRSESYRLHDSGGGGCQLRLEGVAYDGCALKNEVCGVAELGQLVGQRGGHRRRYVEISDDSRGRPGLPGLAIHGAGELLEVERVAAALVEEGGRGRLVDASAQELVRLGPGHRPEGTRASDPFR